MYHIKIIIYINIMGMRVKEEGDSFETGGTYQYALLKCEHHVM